MADKYVRWRIKEYFVYNVNPTMLRGPILEFVPQWFPINKVESETRVWSMIAIRKYQHWSIFGNGFA